MKMLAKNSEPRLEDEKLRLEAAKAADRLFGFYPRSSASDPEIFMTGVIQLFASYPRSVIEAALSPVSGIPAKFKFLPSLAEIRHECEEWYRPIREAAQRQRNEQERQRRAQDSTALRIEGPTIPRPSMDELRRKYGQNFGLTAEPRKVRAIVNNSRLFDRECISAGVDPAQSASPSLRALLQTPPDDGG
jgi:hypothetical protein